MPQLLEKATLCRVAAYLNKTNSADTKGRAAD